MQEIRKLPNTIWAAVAVAAVAFFVSMETRTETVENGVVTNCSSTDVAAIALGVLALILLVSGIRANAGTHPARRAGTGITVLVAALVGVVAIWHLLNGIGVVASGCGS